MSKVFFISDLHLGHRNLLKFEPKLRPFKTVELLHSHLVKNWNSVVTKEDKVIVLGDVFLVGPKASEGYDFRENQVRDVLSSLLGTKILVKGNHDVGPSKSSLLNDYFKESLGVYEFKDAVCTHIPVHPSCLEYRYKFNIHGHLHSHRIPDPRYINVSCEQLDFTPKTYEELILQDLAQSVELLSNGLSTQQKED